ncbi:MAG: hypothetical protein COA50_11010 [Flavobacteriaceae bacterium]|nr:MAG: hypothetical protein COA50_11010 [Flavobacteriaceae bacterium]
MKRRNFMQKTLMTTSAVALGVVSQTNAFEKLSTQQNFDFMTDSHPNIILIHAFFKAYAANDSNGIKKILATNIKWHIPGEHPLSGTKNGVDEVLGYFNDLKKGAFKAEPIVMGVNDDYVIDCHRNWSNLEKEDNLDNMSCLLWKIENNVIVEVFNFPENQQLVDVFFSKLYGKS